MLTNRSVLTLWWKLSALRVSNSVRNKRLSGRLPNTRVLKLSLTRLKNARRCASTSGNFLSKIKSKWCAKLRLKSRLRSLLPIKNASAISSSWLKLPPLTLLPWPRNQSFASKLLTKTWRFSVTIKIKLPTRPLKLRKRAVSLLRKRLKWLVSEKCKRRLQTGNLKLMPFVPSALVKRANAMKGKRRSLLRQKQLPRLKPWILHVRSNLLSASSWWPSKPKLNATTSSALSNAKRKMSRKNVPLMMKRSQLSSPTLTLSGNKSRRTRKSRSKRDLTILRRANVSAKG